LNALKSGIHARSHIIRGEDRAELEALTAAFLLQFLDGQNGNVLDSVYQDRSGF
jgi:hypothetical protein